MINQAGFARGDRVVVVRDGLMSAAIGRVIAVEPMGVVVSWPALLDAVTTHRNDEVATSPVLRGR